MTAINVPMPDTMKEWVEARVRSGRYEDAGDYVRDLIRRDQDRAHALASVQDAIDVGLASGISDRTLDDVLADARRNEKARRSA